MVQDIASLYIDFDAFFANVEKQLDPDVRNKAVGVTSLDSESATLITRCYVAKSYGIKRGMRVSEARTLCPDIVFKPARHDVYVDIHNKILAEVGRHVPVSRVWSIDEVECRLIGRERRNAKDLARTIQDGLRSNVGEYITPSIGLAPNQFLAKVAAELNKPNGLSRLEPEDLPGRLLQLSLTDLPGISLGIEARLNKAGVSDIRSLWALEPKHARKIWGSVEGERFLAQLHGYDVSRPETTRKMFGHSRRLSGEWQRPDQAKDCLRLLTVKSAYRMRREGYTASAMSVSFRLENRKVRDETSFPACADDRTLTRHMMRLFERLVSMVSKQQNIKGVYVMLHDIHPLGTASGDLFDDPLERQDLAKWDKVTRAMDALNEKHEACVIHMGTRAKLPGGYAGAKIAFGRVPDKLDFL